jgi:DNA-binding LytR/AlgR family response regulator
MSHRELTKILIVEDSLFIAEHIYEMLQEEHFKMLKIAKNKQSAIVEMATFKPDIILMDINLRGKNSGIELSKEKNENATVIFITGQNDFALMNEALKTNPHSYLTKPIKKVDVLASINLAILKKQQHSFSFKEGYDTVSIDYSNILYLVADGNYVDMFTLSRKHSIRQTLNTVMSQLPSDTFKQAHRSYVVNKNKVQRVTTSSVIVNNVEIPLSRTYAKFFK